MGKRTVSIDWLRETFDIGERHKAINDFKKIVIKPAVEQINKHSPLFVEWEQQKTGRRVTHFIFTFGPKSERKAAIERQAREAEKKAAAEREKTREKKLEIMQSKKPWESVKYPARAGETSDQYIKRLSKILGYEE